MERIEVEVGLEYKDETVFDSERMLSSVKSF